MDWIDGASWSCFERLLRPPTQFKVWILLKRTPPSQDYQADFAGLAASRTLNADALGRPPVDDEAAADEGASPLILCQARVPAFQFANIKKGGEPDHGHITVRCHFCLPVL